MVSGGFLLGYYLKKMGSFVLTFLELQLFILLVSWPLCIWWGIPLNPTSILGNLLMAPCITVMLALCSLITVGLLLGFECTFLITCFENCSTWWSMVLEYAPKLPNIVCACPHPLMLIPLALSPWIIVAYVRESDKKIILFICFAVSLYGLLKAIEPQTFSHIFKHSQHLFILGKYRNKTFLIDFGKSRRTNSNAYVIKRYLIPEWYRMVGTNFIDYVLVLKSSPSVEHFYTELQKKITLRTIKRGQHTLPS